ncbi:DUF2617 family protein [Conexibacter sp. SYSU D00693]|uniref:DUF2617 family protein n=1 Tax=Conexibacter sp. SYSU D00693 TaxID=2812560 RepID=UPI00196BB2E3|nr:DUF2617 family protein [Conexibacter sp. SYSU D00693]
MIAQLDVPFADARASNLRFSLALEEQPALGRCVVAAGGVEVELRILGASHQAIARCDGTELRETVACVPGADTAVPGWLERHDGPARYVFRSSVERPGAVALRERAAELRAAAETDAAAIVGVFPGAREALTAMLCRPVEGGAAWTTWHLYPGTGEVVRTHSRLVVA